MRHVIFKDVIALYMWSIVMLDFDVLNKSEV